MSKGKSPLSVKFGKRLGGLRKERDWTFVYLSEHSGIAVSFLHSLEHGQQEPTLTTLDVIAKSFDMSMSELLRGI
jgi:transcriptional regulator with XRE-family HTH domain